MKEKTNNLSSLNNTLGNEQNDEEIYIDLKEIFFALLHHWWQMLLAMILLGGLLGAYCEFLISPLYQADASFFITSNDSVISFSDLQLSSALTNDYEQIIKSRRVLNKVIDNLGMTISYEDLYDMVTVTNPTDTHIIQVAVTCQDKNDAVTIANEVLNVSVDETYKVIGSTEPNILDESEARYARDVKASTVKYGAIGALLGLLLVGGIVTIRVMMDTTLKDEEDIEKWLGLPVLAMVPFNSDKNTKKNREYK